MHADFVDDAVRTLRAAAPGDLSRVSEAAAVLAHGDHLLVQVVREARAAGRSWSQIAAALQTSTAVARQRWGSPRQGAEPRWSPAPASCASDDQVQQPEEGAEALVGMDVELVTAGGRAGQGATGKCSSAHRATEPSPEVPAA